MGPIIIFDKSTLESLNPDEAVWLDHFFLSNITPLFFVETLADLEKRMRGNRTAEEVVGSLAYKTPDYSAKPNMHHRMLLEGELSGQGKIEMERGIPHIGGGKTVMLENKRGVLFEPSPEEEAFARWQNLEFLELERSGAKQWRRALSNLDLERQYKAFQVFFPMGKPRSLKDVKRLVDFHLDGPDQERILVFGLTLVDVSAEAQAEILQRWRSAGKPPLKEFAPYFMHVFAVDLFFYLAIAADIIGRDRPSHKIDLAYLYYIPFCMVFTSSDKLHAAMAPFFLRPNQTFVPGIELKADLAKLDAHYSAFSEEEKARGIIALAHSPPKDELFLTTRLWDKHMSSTWREPAIDVENPALSGLGKRLRAEIKRMEEAPASTQQGEASSDKVDLMAIRRQVRSHKGKWARFSKEVLDREKQTGSKTKDERGSES